MPTPPDRPEPTDLAVLEFADQAALEAWLDAEHATSPGIYVKIAKKATGLPSVTYPEIVEAVLCFGWIDGKSMRLDDRYHVQRITPRRPKSIWSQKNVDAVEALTAAGRMRPAGLAAAEAAKADGRWDRAYPGRDGMTVPDDLEAALAADPRARQAFEALDRTNRFAVLFRIHAAATPATRAKRIAQYVQLLADGGRLV
jgi:uncharacterized protein YdeI (YjbR/CyaY-like superfamily)